MRTSFSYFSGGGGADLGLEAAGYTSMGGVEYDNAIADVARMNGIPVTTANVLDVDPLTIVDRCPDWFHASPVCKNASQAKTGGTESDLDIATAEATCKFIRAWLPPIVSIENVWGYREFDAFKRICACLTACGYSFNFWHLCSADYGVPQTRRRLILLARKGVWNIQRPSATHQEDGDMFAAPWIGWYAAIEDLIPTLPASQFAPWQLERLPNEMRDSTLFAQGKYGDNLVLSKAVAPSFTITANSNQSGLKAFIIDGQTNDNGVALTLRHCDEPMYTLSASMHKRPARAFLTNPENTTRDATIREMDEPSFTVLAGMFRRPISVPKAWLDTGRVVSMTPRALARFQSFPDAYQLPDRASLACTVIGNACPPLLIQRLAESVS